MEDEFCRDEWERWADAERDVSEGGESLDDFLNRLEAHFNDKSN